MTTKKSSQEIEELLKKIRDAITDGEYIFRGEPEIYSKTKNGKPKENKVSSNLYRRFEKAMKAKNFNIKVVQDEILKNVKEHTKETDEDAILEQLQHSGGKTNQIDFTTDYFIALFFACDSAHNDDGRLIFLDKEKFKEQTHNPRKPQNRVIAQKSVFVRSPTGIVEPDKKVTIDKDLKKPILSYLEKHHDISTKTIYNDIHGYITRHNNHESSYTNFYLGLIYQNEKQYNLAIKHYTKALAYNKKSIVAYFNRGDAYFNKGEYNKAITNFNKVIELDKNYTDAYNNRGNAYENKNEYDKAIADFNKAIELNLDCADAYNNRGNAYFNKGDYDNAFDDFNKALALDPNYFEAYSNRGNVYFTKGNYDNAIDDFNKSIGLNPHAAKTYFNRGNVYDRKGEYDNAITDFNKAIELNSDDTEAYFNRGNIYDRKGEYDNAITEYGKAIELAKQQKNQPFAERIQEAIDTLPTDPDS